MIGWAWEGVAMTHRPVSAGRLGDQTNPVRPLRWRVVDPSSGRLPGKLQAADKKEEQHLAFSERGRRVRTHWPFDASNFVQPFIRFILLFLAKFLVIIDIVFFIQNKISIYMILSFLTMYRSAKKSTFIAFVASWFPYPTLIVWSWLSRRWVFERSSRHLTPPATPPKKGSNMQLVFQHGPISRESTNIQTIVTIWNGYSRK